MEALVPINLVIEEVLLEATDQRIRQATLPTAVGVVEEEQLDITPQTTRIITLVKALMARWVDKLATITTIIGLQLIGILIIMAQRINASM